MQAISISEAAKKYDFPVEAFERGAKSGRLPALRVRGQYFTFVEIIEDIRQRARQGRNQVSCYGLRRYFWRRRRRLQPRSGGTRSSLRQQLC